MADGLRHVLGVWDRDVEGDKIISKEVTYPLSARGPLPQLHALQRCIAVHLSLILGALVLAARVRSLCFSGAGPDPREYGGEQHNELHSHTDFLKMQFFFSMNPVRPERENSMSNIP